MKNYLAIAVLALAAVTVCAQAPTDAPDGEEQVRALVGTLVTKRHKASVMFHDLTEVHGHIVRLGPDSFGISSRKKGPAAMMVRYDEVLFISSSKGSVSLIPDPKATPFGSWKALARLNPNTLLDIHHKDGTSRAVRYRYHSYDTVTVADKDRNDEWTISRSDVTAIHRVKYGVRQIQEGLTGGSNKGGKVGKVVGEVAGSIRGPISGQPLGNGGGASALGVGIGAGVGALIGALNKSDTLRVLIFSQ